MQFLWTTWVAFYNGDWGRPDDAAHDYVMNHKIQLDEQRHSDESFIEMR